MNKTALTLALLAATAGPACADSAVSVFGTIDLSGKYVKNDGSAARYSLSQDGIATSELGFKGFTDIGNGLKASFVLSSTVNADTGTTLGKFFNRRSTVSLTGPVGELRVGRDYLPTFWNNAYFDAFGTIGIGGSFNVWQLQAAYAASPAFGNVVRADNAIGYFLPANLGGIYGQAMVAAGEGGTNQGRVVSVRVGYRDGPLNVGVSAGQQRFDLGSNPLVTGIAAGSHQNTFNAGAWYDLPLPGGLGNFRVLGFVDHDSRDNVSETRGTISGVVRVGKSEVRLGYHRSKLTNDLAKNTNTDSEIAATYQYNLADAFAIYSTVGRLQNGNHPLAGVTQSVGGFNAPFVGSAETAPTVAGGKSVGFEVGMRYSF